MPCVPIAGSCVTVVDKKISMVFYACRCACIGAYLLTVGSCVTATDHFPMIGCRKGVGKDLILTCMNWNDEVLELSGKRWK